MCARVRARAPRASLASRGEAVAPRSGSLGDSVGYCPPRRSTEAGAGGEDPAPAGRAVAYTRLGRSTLQPPLLPAKRASLQLGPSDPPFLAPGGQGRQRSATSLTPCGTTPPPGRVGCGLPRDSHPSLASPSFHQGCTFSLRFQQLRSEQTFCCQQITSRSCPEQSFICAPQTTCLPSTK